MTDKDILNKIEMAAPPVIEGLGDRITAITETSRTAFERIQALAEKGRLSKDGGLTPEATRLAVDMMVCGQLLVIKLLEWMQDRGSVTRRRTEKGSEFNAADHEAIRLAAQVEPLREGTAAEAFMEKTEQFGDSAEDLKPSDLKQLMKLGIAAIQELDVEEERLLDELDPDKGREHVRRNWKTLAELTVCIRRMKDIYHLMVPMALAAGAISGMDAREITGLGMKGGPTGRKPPFSAGTPFRNPMGEA